MANALLTAQPELESIALAARDYEDRLDEEFHGRSSTDAERAASRLTAWREALGDRDGSVLAERLARDGLDPSGAASFLTARSTEMGCMPPWLATFGAAYGTTPEELEARFAAPADGGLDLLDANDPIAFQELFLPLIRWAREELRARVGEEHGVLSAEAQVVFERSLLRHLSRVCARALFAQFSVYKNVARSAFLFQAADGPSTRLYDTFIERMRQGGLFRFFGEYPVAARLCATAAGLWVDATAEFIERLNADHALLTGAFGGGRPLGGAVHVELAISDAHEGGRGVVVIHFESGVRVVYKPRPVDGERFYAALLAWLRRQAPELPTLRATRTIGRATHGWIEYVANAPCTTSEEVHLYYQRSGMVLALVHALGGSDFHYENLIAAGAHPVLIDLEALMMHRLRLDRTETGVRTSAELAREIHMDSVMKTGLMPMLRRSNDERRAIDVGGLATLHESDVVYEVLDWGNPNTDFMRIVRRRIDPERAGNVPRLGDENQHAGDHVDALVGGFAAMYRLLLDRREALVASGLLSPLEHQPVRFLFRQTSLYAMLLDRLLHPRYLRDGADRFIQIEVLARPLLSLHDRPDVWALLRAERRSLERMDVPFFAPRADSTDLHLDSGERLEGFFQKSAFQEMLDKLARLSEDDLRFQSDLIRMSLHAGRARGVTPPLPTHAPSPVSQDRAREELTDEEALEEAGRIGARLGERAVVADDGSVTWFGVGYLPRSRRHVAGPLSHAVYDGYGGIALFLAALATATGDARYRDLALAAVRPLLGQQAEVAKHAERRSSVDIGVGFGIASAVYTLAHIADLLGEPDLLAEATRYAALITEPLIERDDAFDLLSGSAGAILGLLALYRSVPERRLLEQATRCAEHLLAHRRPDEASGLRVWRTHNGAAECGMAHGAAGISLALYRLAHAAGHAASRDAAAEALAFCRQSYAASAARADAGWAEGAIGLGFVELEAGETAPALAVQAALAAAPPDGGPRPCDSLATGEMGRIDLLLRGAALTRDETPYRVARREASGLLARARLSGGPELGWGRGDVHAGLLPGFAGIGYGLLRITRPHAVPSILAWH